MSSMLRSQVARDGWLWRWWLQRSVYDGRTLVGWELVGSGGTRLTKRSAERAANRALRRKAP